MTIRPALALVAAMLAGNVDAAPPPPGVHAVQAAATQAPAPATAAPVPVLEARIVARFTHDPGAFTEGLLWRDGALYESVGREGQSEIRRVRLADGLILARASIPPAQFGEGLALWKDDLVSLTWHDGIAWRWNAATFKRIGSARYDGEGWGLTSDGQSLIRSDGSPVLRVVDPVTLKDRRRIAVTLNGRPVRQLNELEIVDGQILANVWRSPYIVRIDPASGKVTAVIDLQPLITEIAATDPDAVANGIAYDPVAKRLFVTGKLWPTLFEIALDPADGLTVR